MEKTGFSEFRIALIGAALFFLVLAGWSAWTREPTQAFGGNFAPQLQPQGAKYQIAACDANSAWIIDTNMGDVYLIYANGKWKEVGSILDEKKRIKR